MFLYVLVLVLVNNKPVSENTFSDDLRSNININALLNV